MVDEVLKQLSRRFDAMYAKVDASVDSAGATAASAVAADAVLDPQPLYVSSIRMYIRSRLPAMIPLRRQL